MKTADNKIPVSSVFNDTRRTVQNDCLPLPCSKASLFHAANAFRVTWSERVFFSDTPPKCLDRDGVGRRRTGTRHGDVYRSVREKQGNVVYRQRVLQTVTSLRVVSLVFRGHDLLKIANINPQQDGKKLVPRESAGNGAYV